MYFSKIKHIHVCSAVGFLVVMATAFKYFGIKSIKIPLNLDIRSTRSRVLNRNTYNCLYIPIPLYLNNYPITNKIDSIALKQKNMDSMRGYWTM